MKNAVVRSGFVHREHTAAAASCDRRRQLAPMHKQPCHAMWPWLLHVACAAATQTWQAPCTTALAGVHAPLRLGTAGWQTWVAHMDAGTVQCCLETNGLSKGTVRGGLDPECVSSGLVGEGAERNKRKQIRANKTRGGFFGGVWARCGKVGEKTAAAASQGRHARLHPASSLAKALLPVLASACSVAAGAAAGARLGLLLLLLFLNLLCSRTKTKQTPSSQ